MDKTIDERCEEYITWVETALLTLGNERPTRSTKMTLGNFLDSIQHSGQLIRDMQERIKALEAMRQVAIDMAADKSYNYGLLEEENTRLREAKI